MTLETWLLFALISLAPALSPGRGVLFSVTTAIRYGAGPTIIVGPVNALGVTALSIAVGLGLGAVMSASAVAFFVLKLVGAAYLIYLVLKILRDRSAFLVEADAEPGPAPLGRLMWAALAIPLTNPKATVALAALMPPFLSPDAPALPQVLILSATYGAICVLNHVFIAFAGDRLSRFLSSPGARRWCAEPRAQPSLASGRRWRPVGPDRPFLRRLLREAKMRNLSSAPP